jgi:hypothetical protein
MNINHYALSFALNIIDLGLAWPEHFDYFNKPVKVLHLSKVRGNIGCWLELFLLIELG